MPFLAFGNFTVGGPGADTGFVKNESTEFTYYSLAPALLFALLATFALAARFHSVLDPAYSVAKVWALAPAYLGLLSFNILPNEESMLFAFAPPLLTCVLLSWRWRKVRRIIPAFIIGGLAVMTATSIGLFLIAPTEIPASVYLIESSFMAAALLFPLCIIRTLTRRKQTWPRCFIAYAAGTLLPTIPLIAFLSYMGAPPMISFVILGFISLATVPFLALIKWNPWARDLITGQMFDASCNERTEWNKWNNPTEA